MGVGGLQETGQARLGSLSGRCHHPQKPALELADSSFAAVPPDALVRRSRARPPHANPAARRHDMSAKDKPIRKRKRSDVESDQGIPSLELPLLSPGAPSVSRAWGVPSLSLSQPRSACERCSVSAAAAVLVSFPSFDPPADKAAAIRTVALRRLRALCA